MMFQCHIKKSISEHGKNEITVNVPSSSSSFDEAGAGVYRLYHGRPGREYRSLPREQAGQAKGIPSVTVHGAKNRPKSMAQIVESAES